MRHVVWNCRKLYVLSESPKHCSIVHKSMIWSTALYAIVKLDPIVDISTFSIPMYQFLCFQIFLLCFSAIVFGFLAANNRFFTKMPPISNFWCLLRSEEIMTRNWNQKKENNVNNNFMFNIYEMSLKCFNIFFNRSLLLHNHPVGLDEFYSLTIFWLLSPSLESDKY